METSSSPRFTTGGQIFSKEKKTGLLWDGDECKLSIWTQTNVNWSTFELKDMFALGAKVKIKCYFKPLTKLKTSLKWLSIGPLQTSREKKQKTWKILSNPNSHYLTFVCGCTSWYEPDSNIEVENRFCTTAYLRHICFFPTSRLTAGRVHVTFQSFASS